MPHGRAEQPHDAPGREVLSHLDGVGRAHMVNVTGKPWTLRRALARCRVDLGAIANVQISSASGPRAPATEATWSDLFGTARLAGIQAAKRTAALVPLCHPLAVSNVDVQMAIAGRSVEIEGTAEVTGPTGVEMEALTACAAAALTIVAAVSPLGSEVAIENLGLWEKSGGRSGTWLRQR